MVLFEGNNRLVLQTRSKWEIPNDIRDERAKVSLDESVVIHGALFPENRLRSLSNTYNCVGMVVASRRVWVYPDVELNRSAVVSFLLNKLRPRHR